MTGKLNLTVDETVVSGAKQYAKSAGTSISEMVETYLTSVILIHSGRFEAPSTPVLRSLTGVLKYGGIEDYRKHLTAKYARAGE